MEKVNLMISINVRTLGEVAKELKTLIEDQLNAKVWICVDMTGGQNYRDEIVKAIDKAFAVILLVNNDWAESAECEDEYNYAKRLHLTSKSDPRKPFIIPVAFPDLDWQKRSHIRLLMSSTNAIVVKEPNTQVVWPLLKDALVGLGLVQSLVDSSGKIDFNKHIDRNVFLKFNSAQVVQWLEHVGLSNMKKGVLDNEVTGQDLVDNADSNGLKELGLSSQIQINKAIKLLSEFKSEPVKVEKKVEEKVIIKEEPKNPPPPNNSVPGGVAPGTPQPGLTGGYPSPRSQIPHQSSFPGMTQMGMPTYPGTGSFTDLSDFPAASPYGNPGFPAASPYGNTPGFPATSSYGNPGFPAHSPAGFPSHAGLAAHPTSNLTRTSALAASLLRNPFGNIPGQPGFNNK